jgi:hypothetical protein
MQAVCAIHPAHPRLSVAFSCKRRHFCPSCNQKQVIEFGVWFLDEAAVTVPHCHLIFSIPKLLRRCFLYDLARWPS